VEALVGGGQLDDAAAILGRADDRAAPHGLHGVQANLERARALLRATHGDLDGALVAVNAAQRHHDQVDIPFDRGRTLLVLGQIRRRRKERSLARDAFAESLATFERLGAGLWAERARAELAHTGIRRPAATDQLTDGERRVAELAAAGRTNREVAAALFMSPKTVEAHLARAYQKLGITSRAELGAVIGRLRDEAEALQT
jgi:DNA-binding CsgD family transcriptional regulator